MALARIVAAAAAVTLLAGTAVAQQAFRCTGPDGKVTYQQSPCAVTDGQKKVDITPANTDVDTGARERLLKQEAELDKRLEARAAREAAERREREERERERERETAQREAARESPQYIYAWPPGGGARPPVYPWPRPPASKPGPAPKPR